MAEDGVVLHPALHVAGDHRTQEAKKEPEVKGGQGLFAVECIIQIRRDHLCLFVGILFYESKDVWGYRG